MVKDSELIKVDSKTPVEQPTTILQVIAQAVTDPRLDIEKMERLLAMQQKIMAEDKRTEYFAAMARLVPLLPEIGKHGQSHHGAYARLEDIDRAIRPVYAEEGFALAFDTEEADQAVLITGRLSHKAGHFEEKSIRLPVDKSGSKNGAQAVISTVSYGKRALTKMFFNLIEAGLDDDGNGGSEPISKDQAQDFRAAIDEVQGNLKGFLKAMKVDSIEHILVRDVKKAENLIESKRAHNSKERQG
jgi:hypothetical protein